MFSDSCRHSLSDHGKKCVTMIISMRKRRNRSLVRKSRPHSKKKYASSATCIQKCFKRFLYNRYNECKNNDDDDIFTLNPVYMIPRNLLIIIDDQAFNACSFFKWGLKTGKHPLTRKDLSVAMITSCVHSIKNFLIVDCRKDSIGKRTGFYKRKKPYLKALGLLAYTHSK